MILFDCKTQISQRFRPVSDDKHEFFFQIINHLNSGVTDHILLTGINLANVGECLQFFLQTKVSSGASHQVPKQGSSHHINNIIAVSFAGLIRILRYIHRSLA